MFPMILKEKKIFKSFLIVVFVILTAPNFFAQTKKNLQAEKAALNKKISYTRKLIEENKKNKEATSTQIQLLDKQISFRNQLINNIGGEINEIEGNISSTEQKIEELESYKLAMKEEYKKMIYDAYKNRNSYDKIMYIFSSESFDQAYKRLKVMQQYDELRKSQTEEISATEVQLIETVSQLKDSKNEKQLLVSDKKEEYSKLQENKNKKRDFIANLKSSEKDLKKKINNQRADRDRVSRAIKKILEEEAKKGSFGLTPEGKIISSNFEKNKGKLPWPLSRGVITLGYGSYAHQSLGGITLYNDGIDIATEAGTSVTSVFHGKVTSIFSVSGSGQNVIVTHGAYKTIYCNLQSVSVKKGDAVEIGDVLGKVLTVEGKTILHFELWHRQSVEKSGTINPEYWISN